MQKQQKNHIIVALAGQPNVGKSSLINAMSGAHLKVGNFAGVTIEKAQVELDYKGVKIIFIDLPGTYSLNDYSPEERVTKEFLQSRKYDLVVNVLDSTNLERNLVLSAQILDLGAKTILALNMVDEANRDNIKINVDLLSDILGVNCVPISAHKSFNITNLLDSIIQTHNKPFCEPKRIHNDILESSINTIQNYLSQQSFEELKSYPTPENPFSLRQISILLLMLDKHLYAYLHDKPSYSQITNIVNKEISSITLIADENNIQAVFNYDAIAFGQGAAKEVVNYPKDILQKTNNIDAILLHKYWGMPIFLGLMFLLFYLTFVVGDVFKVFIEDGFDKLGEFLSEAISSPDVASLICDGIIGGVGAVLSFLPLIIILYLGIAILESSGYMARVAFLLDGIFHKFGLHGKSFIPLVAGFGCSVPAYMAARTLKNPTDRLITLFIIGFMSCTARLPIYVLFIGAFFPSKYAPLILFGIYIFGALIALVVAKILKLSIFRGTEEPFVMEMPKYRLPSVKVILFGIWVKVVMFLKKAAGFILLGSMLIWFASEYPKNDDLEQLYEEKITHIERSNLSEESKQNEIFYIKNEQNEAFLKQTYSGRIGEIIAPIFEPMDFDWRLCVAIVTGFAAKEMVVSTLGVLYRLGEDVNEESLSLQENLKNHISLPSAIAFIMFVVFYIPCFAATITFGREAGGVKFVLYLFIFTSIVAYIFALAGYWVTMLFYPLLS